MDTQCKRPGCTGKIVEGVCDDCGRAPAGGSLLSPAVKTGGLRADVQSSSVDSAHIAGSRSVPSSSSSVSSASFSSGSGRTGSSRSGRTGHSSRSSARKSLGAGLVNLPEMPSLDPLKSLMADPVVLERKRYCGSCDAKLNHERGFCPMCGNEYSFIPTLKPSDIVAGQYEVKGAIAYGGVGWIYLAWDSALSRWVVLKGLLNSKDAASAANSIAERQFLASVKHAKIVGVYNFVNHGTEGYIVMEYVGGKTLKTMRQELANPLPLEEAIAYIHGILPAFSYLAMRGLVYCDFKPDNFMLEEGDVKLIDMGGVRRVDDPDGDIYGTKGYSAPEAHDSPSFASDLYTVARTLAVLIMDFKFQGAHEFSLPTPEEQPLFIEQQSLYRWLLKSTYHDPDARFQSADEMADQLIGVLREIVYVNSPGQSAESLYFFGDRITGGENLEDSIAGPSDRLLPLLKIDPFDPAANMLLNVSGDNNELKRMLYERAMKQFPESSEAPLRLASHLMLVNALSAAETILKQAHERDSFDWRVNWYMGHLRLLQKNFKDAVRCFDEVFSELPGELAPKLALGIALEMADDLKTASKYYMIASRTDPSYISATFGLARCRLKSGDKAGAIDAYRRVPSSSSAYEQTQLTIAQTLINATPRPPSEKELQEASAAIESLKIEGIARHRISAQLFMQAIKQVTSQVIKSNSPGQILGCSFQEKALREGAEKELRACARYAQSNEAKIALIDEANRIRPLTLT